MRCYSAICIVVFRARVTGVEEVAASRGPLLAAVNANRVLPRMPVAVRCTKGDLTATATDWRHELNNGIRTTAAGRDIVAEPHDDRIPAGFSKLPSAKHAPRPCKVPPARDDTGWRPRTTKQDIQMRDRQRPAGTRRAGLRFSANDSSTRS